MVMKHLLLFAFAMAVGLRLSAVSASVVSLMGIGRNTVNVYGIRKRVQDDEKEIDGDETHEETFADMLDKNKRYLKGSGKSKSKSKSKSKVGMGMGMGMSISMMGKGMGDANLLRGALCGRRCATHCFKLGAPANKEKCVKEFVNDRCYPYKKKAAEELCLKLGGGCTGRKCPDGRCAKPSTCCSNETKCPDGSCITPPELCEKQCSPNDCVSPIDGGTISKPNVTEIEFAPGMFEVDTVVTILTAQDSTTNGTFDETASVFRPMSRLSYELVVELSSKPILPDIPVTMTVPSSFAESIVTGDSIEVFAMIEMGSNDDGPMMVFQLISGRVYDSVNQVISFILPAIAFTKMGNNNYKAVITLAPTPGGASRRQRRLASGICHGPSIRCPVQGGCIVTSPFNYARTIDGVTRPHYGTDYKAAQGTPILASVKGKVERIRNDPAGYGNYMILRHEDNSATLYAHLTRSIVTEGALVEAEQQIALSGNTGRSTGPHLHFELVPNGEIISSKDRIDPDPCIGQKSQGSITAGDNGADADDAFKLTLNGVVLGTTTIGGSNTLSVNNLIPGTFPLTLEVVIAPDDVGTWFIQLNDGLKFDDGTDKKTSTNPQGDVITFNVIVPGTQNSGWTATLAACSADTVCAAGRVNGGTTASYNAAKLHQPSITSDLEQRFTTVAQEFDLPVALVKAIASRETNMGTYLGKEANCPPGYGDRDARSGVCNGYGIMQVDKRYHKLAGTHDPFSIEHIRQAVGILKDYLTQVVAKFPSWEPKFQLKGAAVAYNRGVSKVVDKVNMDALAKTANLDYGSDVMARAIWFHGDQVRGGSCSSFPGYVFWPGYDSMENDLGPPDDPSKVSLASMITSCSSNSKCMGLNTNGYYKSEIKPLHKWTVWPSPSSSCQGLYIKSPKSFKVNGNELYPKEVTYLKWIAEWTVTNFGMSRYNAIQDYIAKGTWWSLREGVLNLSNAYSYSNCHFKAGDRYIGPLEECKRIDPWIWQVGIAAVQVPNVAGRVADVENRATSVYNQDVSTVLGRVAHQAGYIPGTATHTAIMASAGDLKLSWLLRSHLVGFYFVVTEVNEECLIPTPKNWCYDPSNRYAPDASNIPQRIDEVMVLLQSLTDGN